MGDEGQSAGTRQRAGIEKGAAVRHRDQVSTRRRTPVAGIFRQASLIVYPDIHSARPRRRTMVKTFSVTWPALQHWMAGRRRAPQWAIALLIGEIKKRIAALEHVLALLQANESER